ncbi:acyltransferase family protein [Microbulbifer guangxiensis]|uniref:acyltransferase family protein n=1 Tax=Microbulbifer guangxiensis TaxID=2904249 RepID=UPI001F23B5E5|nr:acyltransferase [Microbulbifer guangxiensis]
MNNHRARQNTVGLESLRGLAALLIIIFHLPHLLKFEVPQGWSIISTHFGLGVPLFYVLSGFVLAFGYSQRLETTNQIVNFYTRRLFRILPLFYSMLFLWMIIQWITFNKIHSLETVFLNVTFLFGLVPGEHESIAWAGWSVGIEMLFYAIFPVLILLIRDLKLSLAAFIASCILSKAIQTNLSTMDVGSYKYMNLVTHLPYFVAGITTFNIWKKLDFSQQKNVGLLLIVLALATGIALKTWDPLFSRHLSIYGVRFFWGIVFACFILGTCITRIKALESRPLLNLGKVSFSLYLTHPMIMFALKKAGFKEALESSISDTGLLFTTSAVIVIAIVWITSNFTYRFIERPGINYGRKLADSRKTGIFEPNSRHQQNRPQVT